MKQFLPPALVIFAVAQLGLPGLSQVSLVKHDLDPTMAPFDSDPLGKFDDSHPDKPGPLVAFGGEYYFSASTHATGRELYKTDGTRGNAQLVHEFTNGTGSSTFGGMATFGGRLYLTVDRGLQGHELWSTGGTSASTQFEHVIQPSLGTAKLGWLTPVGSKLYLSASSPTSGESLFALEPTVGTGSTLVNLTGSTFQSSTRYLVPNPSGQGVLFESTSSDTGGPGLWTSQGTAASSGPIAPSPGGPLLLGFEEPVELAGGYVFHAGVSNMGQELCFTDGTSAGTVVLMDINPGAASSDPVLDVRGRVGGLLYFTATSAANGRELYQTDGTAAGTGLVVDGVPGAMGSDPVVLGEVAGTLLVGAELDSVSVGHELYRLDAGSLNLVKDLRPGATDGIAWDSTFSGTAPLGGKLLIALGKYTDQPLWITDGTTAGTTAVFPNSDSSPVVSLTSISPTEAFFVGSDKFVGREIFRTMGSAGTTVAVTDIQPGAEPVSSKPFGLWPANGGELYITASNPQLGTVAFSKWTQSKGHEVLSPDFPIPFPPSSKVRQEAWSGDHFNLLASSGQTQHTFQLFRTDGSAKGSQILKDSQGVPFMGAHILGSDGKLTYFMQQFGGGPGSLAVTDGTDAGTREVLAPLPNGELFSVHPKGASSFAGDFYLTGSAGNVVEGLWKTDGTAAGTTLIKDINPNGPANLGQMLVIGDSMYFLADDGVHGKELWRSDGTTAGTVLVKDIEPGSASPTLLDFREMGGKLYFWSGGIGTLGQVLWESDGTTAGTVAVAALSGSAVLKGEVTVVGDRLFFAVDEDATGREVWMFDGQSLGLVRELQPGPDGSGVTNFVAVGERLYFRGADAAHGSELFVTDGTFAGTQLVVDVNPGPDHGGLAHTVLCDGDLFFVATDGTGDRELFQLKNPGAHALELGFGGSGARLSATPPTLGSILTATIEQAPMGDVGVLLMSPVMGSNSAFASYGNASWIDPTNFQIMGVNSAATWSVSANVPSSAGFAGVEMQIQAWFLDPVTAELTTSNGLRLVFDL